MADLARIIARMLVARALLSLFNWGTTGGGVFGGALRGMAGNSGGGIVKTASSGLTVSGTSVDSLFPAVILPGSPGLDRTPVLAHGGEMLVPRQRVNATERMLGKVQSSPRHAVAPRSSRGRDRLGFLVNRPFRTTESIDLRNSVLEGIARGERYDV